MSITLQSAVGVNVVFDLVKNSGSSQVFQNVGTSFLDTKTVTASQNIGKTKTAKTRSVIHWPYTETVNGVSKTYDMYFTVEGTVPEAIPFTEVDKAAHMVGTLAASALFKDLSTRRKFSQS